MTERQTLRDFTRQRAWSFVPGAFVSITGLVLYTIASPSPHGYVELLLAIPLMCLGMVGLSLPVIAAPRHAPQWLLWISWVLILTAILPVIGIMYFFVTT
jgi:hypothetical protein